MTDNNNDGPMAPRMYIEGAEYKLTNTRSNSIAVSENKVHGIAESAKNSKLVSIKPC